MSCSTVISLLGQWLVHSHYLGKPGEKYVKIWASKQFPRHILSQSAHSVVGGLLTWRLNRLWRTEERNAANVNSLSLADSTSRTFICSLWSCHCLGLVDQVFWTINNFNIFFVSCSFYKVFFTHFYFKIKMMWKTPQTKLVTENLPDVFILMSVWVLMG